jgi:hypothetical protein
VRGVLFFFGILKPRGDINICIMVNLDYSFFCLMHMFELFEFELWFDLKSIEKIKRK